MRAQLRDWGIMGLVLFLCIPAPPLLLVGLGIGWAMLQGAPFPGLGPWIGGALLVCPVWTLLFLMLGLDLKRSGKRGR